MIRRFYVHNFRCLENFDLKLTDLSSVLLIGKNGSGKSTVRAAFEVLQKIARGTNRVGSLLTPMDRTWGRVDVPVRFELEVVLQRRLFRYELALELPQSFREFRVYEEKFSVDDTPVYTRETNRVRLSRGGQENGAEFGLDWHLVALPIIQQRSTDDPLGVFKEWLARLLILAPVPSLITGESKEETLYPDVELRNFAAWFSGVLAHFPAAYSDIDTCLREVLPDLNDIKNPLSGTDTRTLIVHFSNSLRSVSTPLERLSDSEKCFLICALVLAATRAYGPLCCFWDEPDNHLALSEVSQFVMALRSAFRDGCQLIATSNNPEAIRRFSDENTLVLHRKSHLEATIVRSLEEIPFEGDLIRALTRGDIEV